MLKKSPCVYVNVFIYIYIIYNYYLFSGGVHIFPTIAYLTTCVLKELSEMNSSNETPKLKVSIQAALDFFQILCKHPYGFHKKSESKWRSLLQSTIAKLIDISKTGKMNSDILN